MVIARGEFIYELEKNVEFRQRHAERERVRREKEEAARKFVEEYNRIIGEAAQETEIAIDKKLTEMGLKSDRGYRRIEIPGHIRDAFTLWRCDK